METYTAADARPCTYAVEEDPILSFGKHKGKNVSVLPITYVYWIFCDKSTDNPYKRGNYDYMKESDTVLFNAMKRRMIRHIEQL